MKPEDLDDRTPIEPDDALLESVQARSRSFRRHRTTQRITSVTAGLLVVALAGGIAWTRVDGGRRTNPTPLATTSTTTPTLPITEASIEGNWRLIPLPNSARKGPLIETGTPYLSFNGRGSWTGSDGCNEIGGTYVLDATGIRFVEFRITHVSCSPAYYLPIKDAPRSAIRDDHLTFFDATGKAIARFIHGEVSARIELPATTMTAGATMAGRVVIVNTTGQEIEASGCGSLFAVLLGNATIQQQAVWPDCLQQLAIPAGESSYPITITATYNGCDGTGSNGMQRCLAGGGIPPLPPGEYEARFFQSSPVVIPASPIAITVEP